MRGRSRNEPPLEANGDNHSSRLTHQPIHGQKCPLVVAAAGKKEGTRQVISQVPKVGSPYLIGAGVSKSAPVLKCSPFLGRSTAHAPSRPLEFSDFSVSIISSFEDLCTKRRSSSIGLGGAPKGQRRLDSILLLVLTVLYFPFRQTTPGWGDRSQASILDDSY